MEQVFPEISVIIPTYNRKETLRQCLEALNTQSIESDRFEIIVVDDGSTDGTAETVSALGQESRPRLRYLYQPNSGANAARNRAIPEARGRFLLIINDDTIATPNLIAEHLRIHKAFPEDAVAVLGRMTISPEVPFSIFHELHHDASFKAYEGIEELDWTAFFTCNVSVKKDFLQAYGRFDESLRWHEDIELGQRLSKYGLRIRYNPAALAYHYHYLGEADYLRIAEKEGKALAQWYVSQPELLPELTAIGLHSRALGTCAPRHVFADAAMNTISLPGFVVVGRVLAPIAPRLSRIIFRKVFQRLKRLAIDSELSRLQRAA